VKQKVYEVPRMGNEIFGGVTREAAIFQYNYRRGSKSFQSRVMPKAFYRPEVFSLAKLNILNAALTSAEMFIKLNILFLNSCILNVVQAYNGFKLPINEKIKYWR
jgi:hypothetical protein